MFIRREQACREDHRADVLCSGRLEQVGATACAVTDVVSHEVGDDCGVARIIFRDSGFDLTYEIGADIGSLGVDTAAKLREESDKAGSEAVADDQQRNFCNIIGDTGGAHDCEEAGNTEQAHGHDKESGHRTATKGGLESVVHALHRACRGANI